MVADLMFFFAFLCCAVALLLACSDGPDAAA